MKGPHRTEIRKARGSDRRPRSGFTLPELLVVLAIIGTLSSIGVVSYSSARASARDVKRVSDLKQTQTALELFFENHSYYPGDSRPGTEGLVIGEPETVTLSDGGFAPSLTGTPYMIKVPRNPEPYGTPYVYRSLYRDGRDCDTRQCEAYAILFTLERPQGNYLAGPHAMTPDGIAGAEGGYAGQGITTAGGQIVGIEGIQSQLDLLVTRSASRITDVADDPTVETVAGAAVAPAMAAAAVANTALSTSSAASYFFYFFTQPLLLFGRRKRQAWGVVYNALSRLPEDLVIVRLRDAGSGRLVKSTVTDVKGRYSFLVPKGRYRIEAAKHGMVFPSQVTEGKKEDGPFVDLYHGEVIDVEEGGTVLTPNIPVDPAVEQRPDDAVLKSEFWGKFRRTIAVASPLLGGVSFIITPTVPVGLLFAAQIVMYLLFRRLATPSQPKNWGIVYEHGTGKPVGKAILRIFALPYHKLLETQVTDGHGRYHFRVGGNVYYLTVTKPGYMKTETEPIDLSANPEPTVIASDLPILPTKGGAAAGPQGGPPRAPIGSTARAAQDAAGPAAPAAASEPQTPPEPAPAQPPSEPAPQPPAERSEPIIPDVK